MSISDETILPRMRVHITVIADSLSDSQSVKSLMDIYRNYTANAKRNKKRCFRTKLITTNNGLMLVHGSWWSGVQKDSTITYSQIEQFSICFEKPHKILLMINSKDKRESEYVLIKTKTKDRASQLDKLLGTMLKCSEEEESSSKLLECQRVSYLKDILAPNNAIFNANVGQDISIPETKVTDRKGINDLSHNSNFMQMPVSEFDNIADPIQKSIKNQYSHFVENAKVINNGMKMSRIYVKDNGMQSFNLEVFENSSNMESTTDEGNILINKMHRVDLHPHIDNVNINKNICTSICYYDNNSDSKERKLKKCRLAGLERRSPDIKKGKSEKLSELYDGEYPWEVNISYINHDPMGECVEDESGPIFMYSAHQIVSSELVQSTKGRRYDDNAGTDSTGSSYEDDLERFIIKSRENYHNKGQQ